MQQERAARCVEGGPVLRDVAHAPKSGNFIAQPVQCAGTVGVLDDDEAHVADGDPGEPVVHAGRGGCLAEGAGGWRRRRRRCRGGGVAVTVNSLRALVEPPAKQEEENREGGQEESLGAHQDDHQDERMAAPLVARPRRNDEGVDRQPVHGLASLRDDGPASRAGSGSVVAWVPVVMWMFVILSASADRFSAARTAGWLEWFLHIGFGEVAPPTFQFIHLIVRKSAHLVEYCILGLLLSRALHRTVPGRVPTVWLATAWLLPVVLAASDELHQLTIPSRTGSVMDVGIDTVGAWLGLTVRSWRDARRNSARGTSATERTFG